MKVNYIAYNSVSTQQYRSKAEPAGRTHACRCTLQRCAALAAPSLERFPSNHGTRSPPRSSSTSSLQPALLCPPPWRVAAGTRPLAPISHPSASRARLSPSDQSSPAGREADHQHRRQSARQAGYATFERPLSLHSLRSHHQHPSAAMSSDGRRRSLEAPPPPPPGGASRPPPAPHHPPSGEKGWRYTLRVPSWSQAQLPDGETAVFYQVEVTVLPPQREPRKRSVGRRFSSFVTLFRRLREELGPAVMRGLDPPPRRSLQGVNRKPELVEQRRFELEQWLWRLTESPLIANSIMMFHFCELDAAARMRPRPAPAAPPAPRTGAASPLSSPSGSVHSAAAAAAAAAAGFHGLGGSSQQLSPVHSHAPSWSGSEASELLFGEGSISSSQAGAGLGDTPARPAQRPQQQQQQQQQQGQATPPRQQSSARPSSVRAGSSDSLSDSSSRQQSLLPSASLLPAGSVPAPPASLGTGSSRKAAEQQLRLALPVHNRGAAKAAVRLLKEQLDTAQADLADAARTIAADQQAIAQLAAELQQLQELQQLAEQGGGDSGRSLAALRQQAAELATARQQLAEAEAERAALREQQAQQAQQQEQQQQEQQQQASADSQQHAQAEQQLAALQAERDKLLAQQAEQQRELEAARTELVAVQAERARQAEQQDQERQQLLGVLEAQCTSLQEQLADANAAAAAAAAETEAAAAKSREHLKVLAKEVKSLRKQLAAAQAASAAATAGAAEQQRSPTEHQQQQAEEQMRRLREQEGEITSLREQLAAAAAAAAASASTAVGNGSTPDGPTAAGAAAEHERQERTAALLEAAASLRQLLSCSSVSGSEAAALGPKGMASRLSAANQQLASLKLRVQQQLLADSRPSEGGDSGSGSGGGASSGGAAEQERALRRLLGGLLLDAAAAKQQQHELLRSTLAITSQLQTLEERVLSPTASPVRRTTTAPPEL
ncbi:hypothetical protein ABPG75_000395 [Micractinium tetrahymenae]